MEDLESLFSDDGEFTVGPIVPTEEIIYDTSTGEADEKENKREPDLLHPSPILTDHPLRRRREGNLRTS